jgi:hypothetical protein
MVKRVLLGLLCLALLAGCAGLQKVSDVVCNPTDEQKAEAAAMLQVLDAVQNMVGVFVPEATLVKSSVVLTTIVEGSCFLISDLKPVIELVDRIETVKTKSLTKPQTYPALRKLCEGRPAGGSSYDKTQSTLCGD